MLSLVFTRIMMEDSIILWSPLDGIKKKLKIPIVYSK